MATLRVSLNRIQQDSGPPHHEVVVSCLEANAALKAAAAAAASSGAPPALDPDSLAAHAQALLAFCRELRMLC